MALQKNLSAIMNVIRTSRNLSVTEFSEELGISRSYAQELLSGRGNPRMDTIEHIAARLRINPLVLLSCPYSKEQTESFLFLLVLIRRLSMLSGDEREEFFSLLRKVLSLMDSSA